MGTTVRVLADDDGRFTVTTVTGRTRTAHSVSVPDELLAELRQTNPALTATRLVELSFEFLLEREPAASILRQFSLDRIGNYFPEYRACIRSALPPA